MKKARYYPAGDIKPHIVPVLAWLAAFAALAFILYNRSLRFETVGIVGDTNRKLTAPVAGRIKAAPVVPFQKTERGQPLIIIDTVLDPNQLRAQLDAKEAVIQAKIKQLQAELAATQDKLMSESSERENEWFRTGRNFSSDVEQAKIDAAQIQAKIAPAQIQLQELQINLKIANNNLAHTTGQQQIQTHYEIEKLKTRVEALSKEIEENQLLLHQAEQNLAQAEKRRDDYAKQHPTNPSIELALQPIREEINVLYKNIEELKIENPVVTITSPIEGIIQYINVIAGDAVSSRENLLTIAEARPRYIIAYLEESQMGQVRENMKIKLQKKSFPPKIVDSYVAAIGPSLEQLPQRLWLNNILPQWGLPVLIPIPQGLDVAPGEIVGISGF